MRKRSSWKFLVSSAGVGLVEILVAIGILGVIMMSMAAMFDAQGKQSRALTQKLEILALKSEIQTSQTNPGNCTCLLNPSKNNLQTSPALRFNSTTAGSSMEITTFFGGCDSSDRPILPLAAKNQPLSNSGGGIRVSQIFLKDINHVSGNEYDGEFEIQFDPSSLVVARQPILLKQRFLADVSTPTAATVVSCLGPGVSLGGGSGSGFKTYWSPGTHSFIVPTYTSLTVELWGGGGGGGRTLGQAGGPSSFNATVVAGGGAGGTNSSGGAGGVGSGGDLNESGGKAKRGDNGFGGSSPNGGSGGWAAGSDHIVKRGLPPGGGGGGGDGGCGNEASGGGGGAHVVKTYAAGDLAVGSSLIVIVGAGGTSDCNAGPGARGEVRISWQ